jgi:hypothetical protein
MVFGRAATSAIIPPTLVPHDEPSPSAPWVPAASLVKNGAGLLGTAEVLNELGEAVS